ncbi:MAG TPA: DedA family protein [Candidatus Paceibacterota bacterium]|nr:DedA family protein [Candidatus Paceibacterota bacterium]
MTIPAFIAFLESSKYVLIFIGSYIEGSGVMMATGLLWHLGVVSFWPAYVALLTGDVLSDIMWYGLGRYGARPFFARWGHLINATPEIIAKIERKFHQYHTRILVISKLTMGFGLAAPILTVAGMLHVPFGRYVVINFLGGLVWILFLMTIGYYFGNVLQYIPKDLQVAMAVAMPVLFLLALRAINNKLAKLDW